jgi:hypothetical protein
VTHRGTGVIVSISQPTNSYDIKVITGGSRKISVTEELGIGSQILIIPTGVLLTAFAELDEVDAILRLRCS